MWQFLVQLIRSLFLGDNRTALEVLYTYSAIVLSEPWKHPVVFAEYLPDVPTTQAGDIEAGVWIVPQAVLETLRKRGYSCRYRNVAQFLAALQSEKLLGYQNKMRWIPIPMQNSNYKLPCYLLPSQVLETRQLYFPK